MLLLPTYYPKLISQWNPIPYGMLCTTDFCSPFIVFKLHCTVHCKACLSINLIRTFQLVNSACTWLFQSLPNFQVLTLSGVQYFIRICYIIFRSVYLFHIIIQMLNFWERLGSVHYLWLGGRVEELEGGGIHFRTENVGGVLKFETKI